MYTIPCALCHLIILFAAASVWTHKIVPNPITHFKTCGQKKSSYLCDSDNVFNETDSSSLKDQLLSIKKSLKCFCFSKYCTKKSYGPSVYVSIVKSSAKDVNVLAADLDTNWSGLSQCNDYVILLVVQNQRRIMIRRGFNLASVLPERCLKKISKHYAPFPWTTSELHITLKSSITTLREILANPDSNCRKIGVKNLPIVIGMSVGSGILLVIIIAIFIKVRGWKFNPDFEYFPAGNAPHEPPRSYRIV